MIGFCICRGNNIDPFARTLMTVGSSEAVLTLAAEMAASEATTPSVWPAHVRRDVAHVSRGAIRNHSDCAAVNHCKRETRGRG